MGSGRAGLGSPRNGVNGGGRNQSLGPTVKNFSDTNVRRDQSNGSASANQTSSPRRNDASGLNPNRIRGFSNQNSAGGKVETPSLNAMKAKQGAIVARFMTFFNRKCTLVIEMYEACFYKEKPKWDQIADFVYIICVQQMSCAWQ